MEQIDHAQAVEELEIDLLLEGVFRRFGHDFRGYRRAPLAARLHGLMRAEGLQSISALQDRVLHDEAAGQALLQALIRRPAALFEEPEHYLALRLALGPWLRSCPSPKVWIADCLSAEEACALSILLLEEGLYDRTQIFATAADESLLRQASAGRFPLERMAQYEENYRRSGGKASLADYFSRSGGCAVFDPRTRSNITWAQYNLVTDASFNEFELIVCRRTLGEFGALLRHRTLRLFDDSLSRFGLLSIGDAQDLASAPFDALYRPICAAQGLYRRMQ